MAARQPLLPDWPDASDYAAALSRLLAELDIARCVLAGHSLGALIAARFALVASRRVTALILISPALGYGAEKGSALPPPVARRIEELDRLVQKNSRPRALPACSPIRPRGPTCWRRSSAPWPQVRRPGYDQAARLLAGGRLLDDAAELAVPTMVLVGTQDRITPPANVRRAFDALRASPARHAYREIADAGHALCQEQPDAVARMIAEFVEREASAHA